jgi:hypoxanthine phosphoribosyltransferase
MKVVISIKEECMSCSVEEKFFIIDTSKSLEVFKEELDKNLKEFQVNFKNLSKIAYEMSSKFTTEDYISEIETENQKNFNKAHEDVQEYGKKFGILEVEGSYIDKLDFLENFDLSI